MQTISDFQDVVMDDMEKIKPDIKFMEECIKVAMICIKSNDHFNVDRAEYTIGTYKAFTPYWTKEIQKMVEKSANKFDGKYIDNLVSVK